MYTQSMALIEWLDERHPEPPLMPRDADEKWYVRAVSQIIGCEIHPLYNTRVLKYLKASCGLDDARVNGGWYAHWIAEGFAGPTVAGIFERCMKLPAFAETQPSKQGDAA